MIPQLATISPAIAPTSYDAVVVTPTNPMTVLVDVQFAATMNPQRRPRPTLLEEFDGLNAEGTPWRYRFYDAQGKPMAPRLPLEVDISTRHGKELLKTIKAYRMFVDSSIVIYNPLEIAQKEIADDDLMLDAMNLIKKLRRDDDVETQLNLLRRLEGPIGNKTPEMVAAALSRLAKSKPGAILKLEADPRFKQKVIIDKALEGGRLLLRSRSFYYPESVNEGRMIADDEEKLLAEMASNRDVMAYLAQAAEQLGSEGRGFYDPTAQPVIPLLTDEQKKALAELDGIGEAATDPSQQTGEIEQLEAMNENQIRELIKKAIAHNFLEAIGDKVRVQDGTLRSHADAEAFYVQTPRAAEAVRAEMKQIGLL